MFHTFQRAEPKKKDKKNDKNKEIEDKKNKEEIAAKNKEIEAKNKEIEAKYKEIKKIETDAHNYAWWSPDVERAVNAHALALLQKKPAATLESLKQKYEAICKRTETKWIQDNHPDYEQLRKKYRELKKNIENLNNKMTR